MNLAQRHQAHRIKEYLADMNIRTVRINGATLFYLSDIATLIHDRDYRSFTSDSMVRITTKNELGQCVHKVLDGAGILEYLEKNKQSRARVFYPWIMDIVELVHINDDTAAEYVNLSDLFARFNVDAKNAAEIKDVKISLDEFMAMMKQE